MRKRIIGESAAAAPDKQGDWLGIETSAEAEVSSEDPAFPLESALGILPGPGWKAARPGAQTIRLLFDHPLSVRRIHLEFCEEQRERIQEFVLLWSNDAGKTYREILRQQFNFNSAATREIEDYGVELDKVSALELRITPDLARREALATLRRLQIA
ncbi:MAG TPA: carbohydrate-binding protein [Verrucomicrobiae bacterium]|nr:carbohydrate-binding protein [Verrucomicrobiae bacterium]